MSRPTKRIEGARPSLSKYAQKVADRETGIRGEFEFQERRSFKPDLPPRAIPPPATRKPAALNPVRAQEPSQRVTAVVTHTTFHHGFLFLETADGQSVFLGCNVLERSYKKKDVMEGFVMECDIAPSSNGKAPHVVRILSVSPPV